MTSNDVLMMHTLDPTFLHDLKIEAERLPPKHLYKDQILKIGSVGELQQHIARGAGFGAFLKNFANEMRPSGTYRKLKAIRHNIKQHNKMREYDYERAKMAKLAYEPLENRAVKGWDIDPNFSDERHTVYLDGYGHRVFALRGTADVGDILPDLAIFGGKQHQNEAFLESERKFKQARMTLGGKWEFTGHSLGGSKAMWLAQKYNLRSYVFNPGYSRLAEEFVDPAWEGHSIFMVGGDPVSNSMLFKNTSRLVLLPPVSLNPIKNHAMDNFLSQEMSREGETEFDENE